MMTTDIHSPYYNLQKIARNLVLLEDHLSQSLEHCPDCIVKHLTICAALCDEAEQLSPDDHCVAVLRKLAPAIDELTGQWIVAEEMANTHGVGRTEAYRPVAQRVRMLRKSLAPLTIAPSDPRGSTGRRGG